MLRRSLRRSLDRARVFLGLPPRDRPPLTEEERQPLEGHGSIRDPGWVPESMRAPCGRPPPGERPVPDDFGARDIPPTPGAEE
jgi:hypothetical protein